MKKCSVPVGPLWAFLFRHHDGSMCGNLVVLKVSNLGAYRVRVHYNPGNKSSSIFTASYTLLFLIILGFQMQWHSGFPVVTFLWLDGKNCCQGGLDCGGTFSAGAWALISIPTVPETASASGKALGAAFCSQPLDMATSNYGQVDIDML